MTLRFPPRPIRDPEHISLLAPTRARPGPLHKLLLSLEAHTTDKKRLAAWVYVDEDDAVTLAYRDSPAAREFNFEIHWVVSERIGSQGQMLNVLWQRNTNGSGIYFSLADDYVLATPGWDERVRAAFRAYPDRIALVYPDEASAVRGQVTIPILSAEWLNLTGRFVTDHFPYWFDDAWLDQVAQMIQRKHPVDVVMDPQGNKGKTLRMRNLLFWSSYFGNLVDERLEDAERLRRTIYGSDTPASAASRQTALALAADFGFRPEKIDYRATAYIERHFSHEKSTTPPTPRYLAIETQAVANLYRRAAELWQAGQPAEALLRLVNIGLAERRFTSTALARAVCLAKLGRLPEAREALQTELELNPDSPPALQLLACLDDPDARQTFLHSADLSGWPLTARGSRPFAASQHLSAWEALQIKLMPLTLRLGVLNDILTSAPPAQWAPRLRDRLERVIRRRRA